MSITAAPGKAAGRVLQCGANRVQTERGRRARTGKVFCELPALHGQGCIYPEGKTAPPDAGLRRMMREEMSRHAAQDPKGRWYFWTTGGN